MDADLDTLATALYATTDDLSKAHPEAVHVPSRHLKDNSPSNRSPGAPAGGQRPGQPTPSSPCVMQALLSFTSGGRFLAANKHLRQDVHPRDCWAQSG